MVAVRVAIQCSAAPFRKDRSRATVQREPIGTTPPRAANAVGLYGPPRFKSPILRFFLSSGFTEGLSRAGRCSLLSGHLTPTMRARPVPGLAFSSPPSVPTHGPQSCGHEPDRRRWSAWCRLADRNCVRWVTDAASRAWHAPAMKSHIADTPRKCDRGGARGPSSSAGAGGER